MANHEFAPNRELALLSCNVDDMTGEDIGFAREKLMEGGAMEFYTLPAQMKKGRSGVEIRVIVRRSEADKFAALLMKHTTTFGVRRQLLDGYALTRRLETLQTEHGPVRVVIGEGYGCIKYKFEYEDVNQYANKAEVSMEEARKQLIVLYEERKGENAR